MYWALVCKNLSSFKKVTTVKRQEMNKKNKDLLSNYSTIYFFDNK